MKNIYLKLGILLIAILFSKFASAEDLSDMFKNSADSWEEGIVLTKGIAVLTGLIMSGGALFKMIEVTKSHGSENKSIKVPIVMFFVGAALMTIGTQMDMLTSTFLLDSSSSDDIFGSGGSSDAETAAADSIKYVVIFIQLIGNIAFFRGLYLYKLVSEKKESFQKATIHLLGGVACINIMATAAILFNTFAPDLGAMLGIS